MKFSNYSPENRNLDSINFLVKLIVVCVELIVTFFVHISGYCVGFFLLGTWNRNFFRSTPTSQNGAILCQN